MTRVCGSCQMCCETLPIVATLSPANSRCEHQCASGCDIYGEHPTECQSFRCAWLKGLIADKFYPPECNFFLSVTETKTPDGSVFVGFLHGELGNVDPAEVAQPGFIIETADGRFGREKDLAIQNQIVAASQRRRLEDFPSWQP